jgi:hypothetical protein
LLSTFVSYFLKLFLSKQEEEVVTPLRRTKTPKPATQEVNPAPSAEVVSPPIVEIMDEEIEGDKGKDKDKVEGEDNAPVQKTSPEADERVPKKKKKKKSKSKSKSKSPEGDTQAQPSVSTQPAVVASTDTSKDDPPKVVEETDKPK